jgi:outer membrane lipoprotein SlyB
MHKRHLFIAIAASSNLILAAPVAAKGCIRGAVVGGVAGHYAHHHAVAGAMAGCVAGHMYYKHKATQAAQKKQTAPHR